MKNEKIVKTCTACKQELDKTEFYNRNAKCKQCVKAIAKGYRELNKDKINALKRMWYLRNQQKLILRSRTRYSEDKLKILAQMREYRERNKEKISTRVRAKRERDIEKIRARAREWYSRNKERIALQTRKYRERNKEKDAERRRKYASLNKEKRRAYLNNRFRTNARFRLIRITRNRMHAVLKGKAKAGKTIELLGCTPEEFQVHIESTFLPHMHWNNQGKGEGKWNVDHIIPCDAFKKMDEREQRLCFHYTNLRAMWSIPNIKKGAKFVGTMPLL